MKVFATFALPAILAFPSLSAQAPPPTSGQNENYEFRSHSDLVFLPTVVQKRNGEITTYSLRQSAPSEVRDPGFPPAGHKQVIDFHGAPGMTRTCDLLVRSQTLYPTELRARGVHYSKSCSPHDDSSFGVEL